MVSNRVSISSSTSAAEMYVNDSCKAQRGMLVDFESQAKNHHLHRPMEKFFTDKFEKKVEAEKAATKDEQTIEEDIKIWQDRFAKLGGLIKKYRSRVYICLPCRQKFIDYDFFRLHERASKTHQQNLQRIRDEKEQLKQPKMVTDPSCGGMLQIQFDMDESEPPTTDIPPPPLPPPEDY